MGGGRGSGQGVGSGAAVGARLGRGQGRAGGVSGGCADGRRDGRWRGELAGLGHNPNSADGIGTASNAAGLCPASQAGRQSTWETTYDRTSRKSLSFTSAFTR